VGLSCCLVGHGWNRSFYVGLFQKKEMALRALELQWGNLLIRFSQFVSSRSKTGDFFTGIKM